MIDDSDDDLPDGFELPPAYLSEEPEHSQGPPAPRRAQATTLPFSTLSSRDFERLCARLILREADIRARHLYGVEGEKQHGIDIIGIRPNQPLHRPTYYQCKNVEKFSGADLNKAIDAFQTGPFAAKASELVLIVRAPSKTNLLDAFMIRRSELAPRQIDLELWTEEELFEKLDYHPEIIDKFFGRENRPSVLYER